MILTRGSLVPAANYADMLQLAADICSVPMAMVTSYIGGRIYIDYQHGIVGTAPIGFCAQAVLQDDLLEVPDALQDARFSSLQVVQQAPFVRFYVGAPLISPTGKRLGTLALFDVRPRILDDVLRTRIKTLANQVMVHLELRQQYQELEQLTEELNVANGRLRKQADHLNQAQSIVRVGSWEYRIKDNCLNLSDQILTLYGRTRDEFGGTMEDFIDLVHPQDRPEVSHAKETAIRYGYGRVQCRVIRKDKEVRFVEIIGQMFQDADGDFYLAGTTQDISEQKAIEERIRQLAYYDQLTGLPNRQFVLDRLDRLVALHRRMAFHGAVLFIDLDNFKALNDMHGHDIGDMLLVQVASRLQCCIRHYDCVGRFGGDEFVVLLEQIGDEAIDSATHAFQVAQKILMTLNEPYPLGVTEHRITPSIGIALIDSAMQSTTELVKRADMAMYKAKSEGRNAICFFSAQMQEAARARAALEADLREAVATRAFYLDYQPQVDRQGRIYGVEALLRWRHPTRGLVPPSQFIPLAEEIGLVMEIGGWVLEEACEQLTRWADNAATRDLVMSINVSARQFRHPGFVNQVIEKLKPRSSCPARLKIEITESMLISDIEDIRCKMMALKEVGVQFALDDFGTGYSSMAYLQRLPLDQIKIDQSFVHHVATDKNDAAIARSIIGLAHNLGLSVIAEGVETDDQRRFLAKEGCLNFQGFLYHHPLTARMVEKHVGAYPGPF